MATRAAIAWHLAKQRGDFNWDIADLDHERRRAESPAARLDWGRIQHRAFKRYLCCEPNRRDEARTMLAEIYNWFTEGFDTDLKDAKALLDELK